jgi:hypothetical protein
VRRSTRIATWIVALLALALLVAMSAAGVTAATALLVAAAAIVVMIALGGILGGRHTPNTDPRALPGADGSAPSPRDGSPDAPPVDGRGEGG